MTLATGTDKSVAITATGGNRPVQAAKTATAYTPVTSNLRRASPRTTPSRTSGDCFPAALSPSTWWKCDVSRMVAVVTPTSSPSTQTNTGMVPTTSALLGAAV
eukprot:CAMPEP_0119105852 /NCGR_PEP_ID=MMETSP1180-20130426/3712_1 /TAXON_ID=3052 ORGANISM="Chlamydomonas cf sp, Strain CCMP681" /NCGR_SAMPLE_ID=MMETSP1180 /ASSEMBLY_ACC=CAM_ASM_000741 /LENGTH=102 /DNA_ID=CAMNT_0007091021 /DNA_START=857 /DNA_END=1162 /DNA_ORIENTATION=-